MISVLLPTYNGESFVVEQVNSILQCLGEIDELVIADDNSSDSTVELLENIRDDRIRLFKRDRNIGLRASISDLVAKSRGSFLVFADQDDVWFDVRLAVILPFLDKYDLIVSDCVVVGEDLALVYPSYFEYKKFTLNIISNLISCRFLGSCMAISRGLAEEIFPLPQSAPAHDWWVGVVSVMLGKRIKLIRQPLLLYRRHEKAMSSMGTGNTRPLFEKIGDRLKLVHCLSVKMVKVYLIKGWW